VWQTAVLRLVLSIALVLSATMLDIGEGLLEKVLGALSLIVWVAIGWGGNASIGGPQGLRWLRSNAREGSIPDKGLASYWTATVTGASAGAIGIAAASLLVGSASMRLPIAIPGPTMYEAVAFVLVLFALLAVGSPANAGPVAVASFGFGLTAAAVVLLIDPSQDLLATLIFWPLATLLVGLAACTSSVERLRMGIRRRLRRGS
jgi:hypothetical protein